MSDDLTPEERARWETLPDGRPFSMQFRPLGEDYVRHGVAGFIGPGSSGMIVHLAWSNGGPTDGFHDASGIAHIGEITAEGHAGHGIRIDQPPEGEALVAGLRASLAEGADIDTIVARHQEAARPFGVDLERRLRLGFPAESIVDYLNMIAGIQKEGAGSMSIIRKVVTRGNGRDGLHIATDRIEIGEVTAERNGRDGVHIALPAELKAEIEADVARGASGKEVAAKWGARLAAFGRGVAGIVGLAANSAELADWFEKLN